MLFRFSQRRDDWLFEPYVFLDKPLAISKLLQVPSLDTLLTLGQVIISTQRAKVVLSALTPSHADSVQSPPPLMGELEGVSLRKRQRRVLALLRN